MKKISLILLLQFFLSVVGQSSHIMLWHVNEIPLFGNLSETNKGYRDLQAVAKNAMQKRKYENAADAYQKIVENHPKRIKREDVLNYYYSMLRLGRANEIPHPKLLKFNEDPEVTLLLELVQVRQIDVDTSDMEYSRVDLGFASKLGIRYENDSLYYLVQGESDQEYSLYASDFKDGKLENPVMVNDTISQAVSVLSQIRISKEKRIYSIIPPNKLPARIVSQGKEIPAFPFNSRYYSCSMPYYDAENQRLYFCSDMPGGYGGWDIYYVELRENAWGPPVLLDEQVNTVLDELFPLLHESKLLFSSDGHKNSKGGLDNYAYNPETKKRKHLKNFSTPYDDYCLYFIGNRDDDVYAIGISNNSLVCYKSIVASAPNSEDKTSVLIGVIIGELTSPVSIETEEVHQVETQFKEDLNALTVLSEDTVFFDFDSFEINEKYLACLNRYKELIREKGSEENMLIIAGSDAKGDSDYNYQLSLKRAESLKNYFTERGGSLTEKTFTPLILGECLTHTSVKSEEERFAFLKASKYQFAYPIILAVEKKDYRDLNELKDIFHNSISDLLLLNEIFKDEEENIYLVGVKAIHQVKKKENLQVISRQYNITVRELMRANGLDVHYVHAGKKLIIPMGK
ncbi:LysM peptidoglycan-binding domain-containing protein [Ancylomarina sp. DW003]|nr:LysM peptidoglycan-binding domain-containing protein [Ancylomarina sp. DW003]MDE5421154.1 LysM peptidoglycan-binding domain-containing protein [Ancylomarina sp. DW003]